MVSLHWAAAGTPRYHPGFAAEHIDGVGSARRHSEARRREMLARTARILERRDKFRTYIADRQACESCTSDCEFASGTPAPLFDDDFEFFGDISELASAQTSVELAPLAIDWHEWESLADFFERLHEYPLRAEDPASIRVVLLGEILRRRGFESVLFYDDTGVGLSVCSRDHDGSFDVCEISQRVLETFSAASGPRGCQLAHMEVHSLFELPRHGARTTEIRGDFLFTIYGE